ncbi:MAG: sec-independent protein translocase protein TatB [Frankiaceae bacterium]|jgi:sec-independent protein translocase protein TatB|nr:sec-independent protein translocase protein TatB [Frankiaceae bacterium]
MGLDHLGIWEILVILVVGIVVVGPDRLPKLLQDVGRMFRQLRRMANDATADLREGIGVDDIASLHPRALAREFFAGEDDVDEPVAGRVPQRRLAPGEQPPYDADAT